MSVLEVIDILAVHERLARYSFLADEGDAAGMGELLGKADLLVQGRLIVSRDGSQIREKFSNPKPEGSGRRHVTTNIMVESTGSDSAAATSYFIFTETLAGGQPRMLQTGIYYDTFKKSDGTWYFTERSIFIDGQPSAV